MWGNLLILKEFLVFMNFKFEINIKWTIASSYAIRGVTLACLGEVFVAFY